MTHSFISSIGTANPENRIDQKTISEFMLRHLPLTDASRKLVRVLYRASGIQYRHTVIPDFAEPGNGYAFFPANDALEPFPSVSKRMQLYQKEAIKLSEKAALDCLTGFDPHRLTHLITVSCTGMYAPGIDIELIERLGLATDIQRTSINFMGCYASFNALKVAREISKNDPQANILVVAVELCSIHLLKKTDEDSLLSNALFGDGAAAVLIQGERNGGTQLEFEGFYSDLSLDGKDEMSWHISDFGFQMKLSAEVPKVIQKGIGKLTRKLLERYATTISEVDHFAIHPGGKRILEVIEQELGIKKEQNQAAYHVLKNYGNMSSPTVLFVLKEVLSTLESKNNDESLLSFAFGPGLTLESMLLKIVG